MEVDRRFSNKSDQSTEDRDHKKSLRPNPKEAFTPNCKLGAAKYFLVSSPTLWEEEIHVPDEEAAGLPKRRRQSQNRWDNDFSQRTDRSPREEELISCANFLHHTFRTERSRGKVDSDRRPWKK
ncbi:hypothetical protein HNY73_003655 [Argiope bruennichi]|uniref:Uncharacterized protein n=1 Tax=Argiope bruennichi TaxID=94029 RepID=A0A8T0FTH7_ARGBR|nr:hypothetical protein HNY73_003655 [Argiope bruennichi]